MPVSYFSVDVLTQHNIQLVVYIKKMQELVTQIQSSFMVSLFWNISLLNTHTFNRKPI